MFYICMQEYLCWGEKYQIEFDQTFTKPDKDEFLLICSVSSEIGYNFDFGVNRQILFTESIME